MIIPESIRLGMKKWIYALYCKVYHFFVLISIFFSYIYGI